MAKTQKHHICLIPLNENSNRPVDGSQSFTCPDQAAVASRELSARNEQAESGRTSPISVSCVVNDWEYRLSLPTRQKEGTHRDPLQLLRDNGGMCRIASIGACLLQASRRTMGNISKSERVRADGRADVGIAPLQRMLGEGETRGT